MKLKAWNIVINLAITSQKHKMRTEAVTKKYMSGLRTLSKAQLLFFIFVFLCCVRARLVLVFVMKRFVLLAVFGRCLAVVLLLKRLFVLQQLLLLYFHPVSSCQCFDKNPKP